MRFALPQWLWYWPFTLFWQEKKKSHPSDSTASRKWKWNKCKPIISSQRSPSEGLFSPDTRELLSESLWGCQNDLVNCWFKWQTWTSINFSMLPLLHWAGFFNEFFLYSRFLIFKRNVFDLFFSEANFSLALKLFYNCMYIRKYTHSNFVFLLESWEFVL